MEETMSSQFLSMFTATERAVGAILLELPELFAESEYSMTQVPFLWGAKRQRSGNENARLLHPPVLSSLSSTRPTFEPQRLTVKVDACSPATPLSFSPSKPDKQPKRMKRKTKEEWVEIIDQYLQSNEFLRTEIGKVRCYYDQQKAENLALKARKQELSLNNIKRENSQLEANKNVTTIEMKSGKATIKSPLTLDSIDVHQSPFIMDWIDSENCPYSNGFFQSSTSMIDNDGVSDFNASPVEFVQLESIPSFDSKSIHKAKAAQARQRRMQICKNKNSLKLRPSYK